MYICILSLHLKDQTHNSIIQLDSLQTPRDIVMGDLHSHIQNHTKIQNQRNNTSIMVYSPLTPITPYCTAPQQHDYKYPHTVDTFASQPVSSSMPGILLSFPPQDNPEPQSSFTICHSIHQNNRKRPPERPTNSWSTVAIPYERLAKIGDLAFFYRNIPLFPISYQLNP